MVECLFKERTTVNRYDFNINDAFQDDGKSGAYVLYSEYQKLEEKINEMLEAKRRAEQAERDSPKHFPKSWGY